MPHGNRRSCRHCDMVENYRLARDTYIRQREVSLANEEMPPVLFKWWLQVYEWEREPC